MHKSSLLIEQESRGQRDHKKTKVWNEKQERTIGRQVRKDPITQGPGMPN